MKKLSILIALFVVLSATAFAKDIFSTDPGRQGELRMSTEATVNMILTMSTVGVGANYSLNDYYDLFVSLGWVPYPLFESGLMNYTALGGARWYFAEDRNSWYLEAGGGVFGGFALDGSSEAGFLPVVTLTAGYEFEMGGGALNVDAGVFYLVDPVFAMPFPCLSISYLF